MIKIGDAIPMATQERTCTAHGAYQAMQVSGRWSSCPQCMREKIAADSLREAQDRARHRRDALAAAAGVPPRYARATIGDDQAGMKVRAWLRSLLENPGANLLLLGHVGTGKTHLACGLIRAACEGGIAAQYESVQGFLRKIRETWDSNERTEKQVFERAAGAGLLVLDEVGAGLKTDKDAVRIHELIAERYDRALPTVAVSNLTPQQLKDALGDRAYDRLRDGGTLITLTGDSRRLPAKQQETKP